MEVLIRFSRNLGIGSVLTDSLGIGSCVVITSWYGACS